MLNRIRESLIEFWFMLRHWAHDWFELFASPFRAARQIDRSAVRQEVAFGSWQFLGILRDVLGLVGHTVAAFFWFMIRLPYNSYFLAKDGLIWLWNFLWLAPKSHVILGVSLVVLLGVGVVGPLGYLLWEKRVEKKLSHLYNMLDQNLAACDPERTLDTLTKLQAWARNDETVAVRLDAIQRREAPVNDPKLLRLLMRGFYREQKFDLAAREARKLVESSPADWEALCILADEASRKNDSAGVKKYLAALPSAESSAEHLPPWVAWYAAQLFQRLNEQAKLDDVIDHITRNILPVVRSRDSLLFEIDAKLLLIDCYRLCLTQIDRRPRLTQYWTPVQALAKSIVDNPEALARQLVWLGQSQQIHLDFLEEFVRRKLIKPEEAQGMRTEVESRIGRIWERTIALDPKIAAAYIGQAEHQYRTGQPQQAIETINRGLMECGGTPELVADKTLLLRRIDPQAGFDFLDRVATVEMLNPGMCQVYAQAAIGAGRPDKALEACRFATRQQPGLLWAARTEAEICLMLNRPTEAAAALKPVQEFISIDPATCSQYVKALCGCGSKSLADQFLEQADEAKKPTEVLLEGAYAFLTTGNTELAEKWSRRVLDRDPVNPRALLAVAESLRIQAELPERGWNVEKARESLQYYTSVARQQPDNLAVVNNIVWLELKALNQPKVAYESAAPLRSRQNEVSLPAEYQETLAVMYCGLGEFKTALKLINQAMGTAGARASFFLHRAQIFIGLQQPESAEQDLLKAVDLPKTLREVNDLLDISRQIQKR